MEKGENTLNNRMQEGHIETINFSDREIKKQASISKESKQGRITQTTVGINKIYINCTSFFTNLEDIVEKYRRQDYIKEDINVILDDYDGMVIPLKTLEEMRAKINEYTADIDINDNQLTKFVKSMLSINKNSKIINNADLNFSESILKGRITSSMRPYMEQAILESQGIETRSVIINGRAYKEANLNGEWCDVNQVLSKYRLPQNVGLDLYKQIQQIVKKCKKSIPKVEGIKVSVIDRMKALFSKNKQEEKLYLSESTQQKEKQGMQIKNYSPAGMIDDKILWEILTYDSGTVKNEVRKGYVLLPKIGNPEQIFELDPEAFTKIYNGLMNISKEQGTPFLGSIEYDEQEDALNAFTMESKEMQRIKGLTTELIENKRKIDKIVQQFESVNKEVQNNPDKQEQLKSVNTSKPQPQIDLKKQNKDKQDTILQPKTIVFSDLHCNWNNWTAVRTMIAENPNLNVIILGDTMDRGEDGIIMLLQIKEISDEGRIEYVPGNHDEFTFNTFKGKLEGLENDPIVKISKVDLINNGGKETFNALNNFEDTVKNALKNGLITKPITLRELIDWLGSRPIQTTRQEDGVPYALAHAMFDMKLYKSDKNFNLEKAFELQMKGKNIQNSETIQSFKNVLWYREKDKETHYGNVNWPSGYNMIVGHTSQKQRS